MKGGETMKTQLEKDIQMTLKAFGIDRKSKKTEAIIKKANNAIWIEELDYSGLTDKEKYILKEVLCYKVDYWNFVSEFGTGLKKKAKEIIKEIRYGF